MAKKHKKPTRETAKSSEVKAKHTESELGVPESLLIPKYSLLELLTFAIGTLLVWILLPKLLRNFRRKRISKSGYILIDGQFEHRMIAEKALSRKLAPGEVVHHINGRKRDNNEYNLCVMANYAHEEFHRWLNWRFMNDGRYPAIRYQRAVLRDRYHGILLVTSANDLPRIENDYDKKVGGE